MVKTDNDYKVGAKKLTVDEKMDVLKQLGREDLIDLFKEWKPRKNPRKQKGAPLDQRVSITITDAERSALDVELKSIQRLQGSKNASLSSIVRSRAISTIDVQGWKQIAERELKDLDSIEKDKDILQKELINLAVKAEDAEDSEEEKMYDKQARDITNRLDKLKSKNVKRSKRLSGRMSRQESERVKWYAQRLCISTSDYLRMLIFNLEPGSIADAHMPLDAKKRFYISIIDVAMHGWGNAPTIYGCSQCENYLEEMSSLQERVRELEEENKILRDFS